MRILQLCKKFPFPTRDGETIAVTYLSKALVELGCEMTLLSMNTSKHYTDLKKLPKDFNHYKAIYSTTLDNELHMKDAFLNLFSPESYHVSRYVDKSFRNELIRLLNAEEFDIVQLETLYLAPYLETIKENSSAFITMRAHNVEFEIWERITKNTTFLPKKWYLKYLTNKLRNFELSKLNQYDYLIPVSDRDLHTFKQLGYENGAFTSPIGLNSEDYSPLKERNIEASKLSLCFIGALDWMPNLQALEWFLSEVWPKVIESNKSVQFNVAGRNTPKHLFDLNLVGVNILGEINNAISFINDNDIMVVPLFSGSGMRVKILEGMALGKTVITTTLGLEGINANHMKEIIIADDPDAFISQINNCREQPELVRTIGTAAREFVVTYYDNKKNAKMLLDMYRSLLAPPEYN